MEHIKPNGKRAKHAVLLIFIVLALEVAAFLSGIFHYNLLENIANGGLVSEEAAGASDMREAIIALLYLAAFVTSGITFIMWFRRAYYNLHIQGIPLSYSESWAAGSWFVPIAHFYYPYKIMKELYEETKKLLLDAGVTFSRPFSVKFLGIWWALWIISSILGQFIFRFSMKAESVEELMTGAAAGMTANLIGIPLALITVKVIKDYANAESLLYALALETKDEPFKSLEE